MNLLNYSRSIFKELYFKNKTQTNHLTLLGCITIIKVMAIGINEKRVSGGILVFFIW
jgi:small neutral amino acid transporter SnatA (MarC family)